MFRSADGQVTYIIAGDAAGNVSIGIAIRATVDQSKPHPLTAAEARKLAQEIFDMTGIFAPATAREVTPPADESEAE